jgi:hypothetical protein
MVIIRIYISFRFGEMAMNAQHSTENLTIHHKVKDYATWRKGYDEHEKSRLSAGVTNGRVFRRAEDPNDILILLDVADVAKARTWLGGDDLKTAMHKAGVVGSPSIRFAT